MSENIVQTASLAGTSRCAGGVQESVRNSVAIITSPRPRVGKTLLARLPLQEDRPVAVFDLNVGEGTLAQFLPGTSLVRRSTTSGRTSFERFFVLANQFGFTQEASRRGTVSVLLYLMSPDRTSIEAYRGLCSALPEVMLAPIHNEIFGVAQYAPIGSGTVIMRLPLLNVRKYVERPPCSFAAFRKCRGLRCGC